MKYWSFVYNLEQIYILVSVCENMVVALQTPHPRHPLQTLESFEYSFGHYSMSMTI